MLRNENKMSKFYKETEKQHLQEVDAKRASMGNKAEAIRQLRIRERHDLRELEKSMSRKQRESEELKRQL
jgi:hypothetical protein